MNTRLVMLLLLLMPLLLFSDEEEIEEGEEDYADFDLEEQQCDCDRYNPLRRYYPYRRIFQDSVIRQNVDDEQPSWPSRRDSELWDELTR